MTATATLCQTLLAASPCEVLFRSRDHVVDDDVAAAVAAKGGEVVEMTLSGITARRVCMRASAGRWGSCGGGGRPLY